MAGEPRYHDCPNGCDKCRAEERAAIVAWLREYAERTYRETGFYMAQYRDAADAIERGDHMKGGG